MIINDAIMHIYDKETGIGIFSDQSMDLKSDFGLYEYLEKHLRKCMKGRSANQPATDGDGEIGRASCRERV